MIVDSKGSVRITPMSPAAQGAADPLVMTR
jgi:hypothetical protein